MFFDRRSPFGTTAPRAVGRRRGAALSCASVITLLCASSVFAQSPATTTPGAAANPAAADPGEFIEQPVGARRRDARVERRRRRAPSAS